MRYTGHLDLHRAWERTFRRARLPLAYSQGFHPQPRLNLACALPLASPAIVKSWTPGLSEN
jgi:radical SAM-linked protein